MDRCNQWCAHNLMCGLADGHETDPMLTAAIAEEGYGPHPCYGCCNALEALGVAIPKVVGPLG